MNAAANRDAGFALLVVLAFLALAASVATPFLTSTRTYAFATRNIAKAAVGSEQVRGAMAIAAAGYAARALDGTDLPNRVTCVMPQPGITIAFDFQNHAGLVDLNAASAEALKTGFLALGVPGEMAAVLAKEAEEYRTTNLTGATSEFQDGVVGGLKHGPFETPLELLDFQLLKHIDPDQLLGSFTVLSRSGTIHVQSAPGLIREAAERAAATSIFSSAIRLPAFSVNAVLHDASRHGLAISGAADYVTADASLILTGPVRLGLGEKSLTSRPTADDCVSFFTPQTLAALRRLF